MLPELSKNVEQWLPKLAASPSVRLGLSLLIGIGALQKINALVSQAALNNFTWDPYDWQKEVVVVTGGSGGLGDLLVRKLAKQCFKVISLDVVPSKTPLPSNVWFYQVDITSSASLGDVAQKIRSEHGDPSILVNNAGIMHLATILDESEEQVRRIFEVNIIAHFLLMKEFLPSMIEHDHGHIVTLASLASFVTGVKNVDYSCTKAGALAFHEGLTQELKHSYNARKVRTSIIHPTYIRTPLIDKVHRDGKFQALLLEPEAVVDVIVKHILSGNSGQIVLPGRYSMTPGARGWPLWMQEILRSSQRDVLNH